MAFRDQLDRVGRVVQEDLLALYQGAELPVLGMLADAVATIGGLNVIAGELDR